MSEGAACEVYTYVDVGAGGSARAVPQHGSFLLPGGHLRMHGNTTMHEWSCLLPGSRTPSLFITPSWDSWATHVQEHCSCASD